MAAECIKTWKCFEGEVRRFKHVSSSVGTPMIFGVYLPPQAATHKVPSIYFLSGLTCTDENFMIKSGAQRYAAEHGVAIICPDTSPRGDGVPTHAEGQQPNWDFAVGAGFYVNASQTPFDKNYRMYDYVCTELPSVIASTPALSCIDANRVSITGHSMGGLGALQIALKSPAGRFKCCTAFAPIAHPSVCPWGQKAFTNYLGAEQSAWKEYDPTELVKAYNGSDLHLLIDQGAADEWLEAQLSPEDFLAAASSAGVPCEYRKHEGYDHGYFFISTFIGDHIAHHAKYLKA